MSFFGKQFKKVKAENASEVLGKLNLSDQTVSLITNPDTISTFSKNTDGTLQYVVKSSSGALILDQKIVLAEHRDFTSPDGMDTNVKFVLDGDVLKSHFHLPDGSVVYMNRYFEANGMKMEMYIKGAAEKATVYYEVV
ncbi:uncharacterized protein LOC133528924 [Cydia pomonella]|uniref:uncharacterized protein LOC133528924 n=1 Tax=Cydia pomonella TaxID=82600 RepID=UPI002ADE7A2D|nr:uncharacterized protein LOC133528924 [Cydia pomonella]